VFIRIVAVPPGEAPEEVRRAWVGLVLPLAAGEFVPRRVRGAGVLTGPRSVLGWLLARLTGRSRYFYGYVVHAAQAVALLSEQAPGAAQWWRECAPHACRPGRCFLFAAEVCERLADRPSGPPPAPLPSLNRTPSDEFYPGGPSDVTRNPVQRRPGGPITERPRPDVSLGFGSGPASFRPEKWLAWGGGVTFLLWIGASIVDESLGLPIRGVGPGVFAVAAVVWGVLLGLWLAAEIKRKREQPGGQPAPGAPEPIRTASVRDTAQDRPWLFLSIGLALCGVGLWMLLSPVEAGLPKGPRLRDSMQQWIAPSFLFLGTLAAVLALGSLSWRLRPDPGAHKALRAGRSFLESLGRRIRDLLEGQRPRKPR
jgi:hypothetical protein